MPKSPHPNCGTYLTHLCNMGMPPRWIHIQTNEFYKVLVRKKIEIKNTKIS